MTIFFTVLVSILLSVFSTAVMSYIAMATPLGPWIAPTLVLCALLIFKGIARMNNPTKPLMLATSAGSIGGIVATACGFSFPTLYFVDPDTFNLWLASPWYFAAIMAGLVICAGWFGMYIAHLIEPTLLIKQQLSFPVGQLTYKMIAAAHQLRRALELSIGFVGCTVFVLLQDGFWYVKGIIPASIALIPAMRIGALKIAPLRFDLMPMLWAIGFIAGELIAIPLLVGMCGRIVLIDPLNAYAFSTISNVEFVLAFCSGIVLAGTISSFLIHPRQIKKTWRNVQSFFVNQMPTAQALREHELRLWELVALLAVTVSYLSYFGFSLIAQLFLLVGTAICTYQIAIIAGKIGLAPLGRFATFVMVPAMFLFKLNFVQIVLVATFVEIAGGIASDYLFSKKMAQLGSLSRDTMRWYQYMGLLVCACTIGAVFWLLITHFGLGSAQLFAQRAQGRQLLISAKSFNYIVLALGFGAGYLLKYAKMNPLLVLGGILMPFNISLGLIAGGLISTYTKDPEQYYPAVSGVFAAHSLWMLIQETAG